MTKLTSW